MIKNVFMQIQKFLIANPKVWLAVELHLVGGTDETGLYWSALIGVTALQLPLLKSMFIQSFLTAAQSSMWSIGSYFPASSANLLQVDQKGQSNKQKKKC